MNGLFEAAAEIQAFFQQRGWRFCFIGGLAVIRFGQPRATQDVDVNLFAGFGKEESYVDAILERFAGRIEDSRRFGIENRVVLCRASNSVPVDVALAGIPFEERMVSRATTFEFSPGAVLLTASAEDMIVLKSFAGRDRDWADVEGILVRQGPGLDWSQIRDELVPLCRLKDSLDDVDRLERLREEVESG